MEILPKFFLVNLSEILCVRVSRAGIFQVDEENIKVVADLILLLQRGLRKLLWTIE